MCEGYFQSTDPRHGRRASFGGALRPQLTGGRDGELTLLATMTAKEWQPHLLVGERLFWSGESKVYNIRLRLFWASVAFFLFVSLELWEAYPFQTLAQLCGPNARPKCVVVHFLAWPIAIYFALLCMRLLYQMFDNSSGACRNHFAISN